MSLDKKYLKSKPICKVKFIAPEELAKTAKKIYLAGEFNEWDCTATQMKKQKNGTFATTLELAPGQEYQYRFVLDGERWATDHDADKCVHVGHAENSVVVV